MNANMDRLEALARDVLEGIKRGLSSGESVEVTNHRIAVLSEIHELLDPWQPCQCDYCEFHVKHGL